MKKFIAVILSLVLVLAITIPAFAISAVSVKSIKLNNAKITLEIGKTSSLKVTFTPTNTTQKKVTYASSNKKVATVSTVGKITAVAAGTATITATAQNKITAKCVVTVKKPVVKPKQIIMLGSGASLVDTKKNATFEAAVSKILGLKFKHIYDTEGFNRIALMMAAGEKLDVIYSNTSGFFKGTQRLSVEIKKEWIDNSVNLKQIPTDMWQTQRAGGVTYGIPYRYYSAWVTWVRQDWLDNLGLNVPKTVDDYVAVGRAFTNNDPDKNGKKDTYGFSASNLWDSVNQFFYPFQNAFVKYPGEWAFDTKLNKYLAVWLTPEYKNYMKWLRGLNAEGIIDPVIPTNEHVQYYDGFYAGKYGFLTGFAHEADTHVDKLKAVNPAAKMIPIAPPKGAYKGGYTAGLSDLGFAIMRSCDNPEGVTKYFLDWTHSNEGYNMFCYGPEGMNWKKENGVAVKIAENPSCLLTPQNVILKNNFKSWLPTRQEGLDAFNVNKANVEWRMGPKGVPPLAPNNDDRQSEWYMKSLELWLKMFTGDITVDEGFAQMEDKWKSTKCDEYFDMINSDLSWNK